MSERENSIRLGIIGSGRIARRFVREALHAKEICIEGVYNPHAGSASRFVEKILAQSVDWEEALEDLQLKAYDNWNEFMTDVDAVYIATPHGTHVDYAKRALDNGKHVLCEKAMAFSEEDARALFDMSRQKGLVLKEAIKTADAPGFKKIEEVVETGVLGEIVHVEANFTRLTLPGCREYTDTDYAGSFIEFGTYLLMPVIHFLGIDIRDIQFYSRGIKSGRIIPWRVEKDGFTEAVLVYDRGIADIKTGLTTKTEGDLVISGTKGYLLARSPWWLTRSFDVVTEDAAINKMYTQHYEAEFEGDGLRYELRDFADRIFGKKAISDKEVEYAVCRAKVFERFIGQEV